MLVEEKYENLELVKNKVSEKLVLINMPLSTTNPIMYKPEIQDKLSVMVKEILDKELPDYKNNSLLHDLVLYNLYEKVRTVQTYENVLSYIKTQNVKEVKNVCFRDGEGCLECSI